MKLSTEATTLVAAISAAYSAPLAAADNNRAALSKAHAVATTTQSALQAAIDADTRAGVAVMLATTDVPALEHAAALVADQVQTCAHEDLRAARIVAELEAAARKDDDVIADVTAAVSQDVARLSDMVTSEIVAEIEASIHGTRKSGSSLITALKIAYAVQSVLPDRWLVHLLAGVKIPSLSVGSSLIDGATVVTSDGQRIDLATAWRSEPAALAIHKALSPVTEAQRALRAYVSFAPPPSRGPARATGYVIRGR